MSSSARPTLSLTLAAAVAIGALHAYAAAAMPALEADTTIHIHPPTDEQPATLQDAIIALVVAIAACVPVVFGSVYLYKRRNPKTTKHHRHPKPEEDP